MFYYFATNFKHKKKENFTAPILNLQDIARAKLQQKRVFFFVFNSWQKSAKTLSNPTTLIKLLFNPRFSRFQNENDDVRIKVKINEFSSRRVLFLGGVSCQYTFRHFEINRKISAIVFLPIPNIYFYSVVLDKPYFWTHLLVEFHNYFRHI